MTTLTQIPSAKVPLSDSNSGLITTQWYRYFFNLYTLTQSSGVVLSVTATSPLTSSGGISPNIAIPKASGAQAGYLSASDWTTFNNKPSAGISATITTAKLTVLGANGSMTFTNGVLTAQTAAT